ncbi:MAG: NUDIX hydrolase [Bacteroidetes bacterium]|nr:NUDIX hydrolase [Bacteroidota bacterium]
MLKPVYKIFAKDKCVYLVDDKSAFPDRNDARIITFVSASQLMKEYETFIQQEGQSGLYIFSADLELLWKEYRGLFQRIEAAGGVVKNRKDELLLIFRHKRWDLPKGKIEKGEEIKHAALREVQEECGIKEIKIIKELPSTYHTYLLKNKHVLKRTYWFEMNYSGSTDKLIPQLEESITDARWMNAKEVWEALKNTYPLIKEVLNPYS